MSMLTGSAPAASSSINFDPTIRTQALRRALLSVRDEMSAADLKFLEKWELSAMPGAAAALRASQLRRANPKLLAEIQAELKVAKG
jgi:hypothetical protein